MRQASSKIKMHISNISIINNNIEGLILHTMLCFFAVLALSYVFFLGNMVFNIVERRTLESESRTLLGEVGDLELTYLSMSKEIDLNLSRELGFQEAKINFATRPSLGLGFKGNNNEI